MKTCAKSFFMNIFKQFLGAYILGYPQMAASDKLI